MLLANSTPAKIENNFFMIFSFIVNKNWLVML